ncbi:U-box domain-containing protein [Musa troglodytarum]|uniref:U-box domain-containing protein n=1 Tax=Musa troglodytarum TaxID=320322 RepID=A0A9E7JC95_9LILI|nr:U-box domain-containing protein [Musa troglodytarum]
MISPCLNSTMEILLLKALLDSITKFGHVSSSSNVKPALVQKYCQIIDQILEHFKSVCDEIAASEISLDEQLVKGLEELDALVNEAREHMVPHYLTNHFDGTNTGGEALLRNHSRSSESHPRLVTSQSDLHTSNGVHQVTYLNEKPVSSPHHSSSGSLPVQIANGSEANIPRLSLESAEGDNESSMDQRHVSSSSQTVNQPKQDSEPSSVAEQFPGHNWTDSASLDISSINHLQGPEDANLVSRVSSDLTHCSSDAMGEVAQDSASSTSQRESEFPSALEDARFRSQSLWRRPSAPRIISSQSMDSRPDISGVEAQVRKLIEDLKSESLDLQITATAELRLLAKHNMENRIVIANCGVISLLVDLLHSTDSKIQENAVTALLNLSINDNNKIAIANAGVDPLIYVLETGNPEAKENSAATLFSLSVIEENKVRIGGLVLSNHW